MKLRAFAPTDASVAALFLLIVTVVAVSGFLTTEEVSGFLVPLRQDTREHSVPEIVRSAGDVRVNLNRAGASLLATLPGIGLPLAEAIVRFRDVHGPFRNLADLQRVPRIGPKRLEKVRPYLTVGDEATWPTR